MLEISRVFVLGHATRRRPFAQIVAGDHDLADDLGRGQIAHQALGAGMAERTGQRAAHLRRDAQRAAIGIGDIDGLDLVPAGHAQQVFPRAVGRDLAAHDLRHVDREPGRQQGAIGLRQIGHQGEIAHPLLVEPLPKLGGAHAGLFFGRAGRDQRRRQLRPCHADQIDPFRRRQSPGQGQHILRHGCRGDHPAAPVTRCSATRPGRGPP
jgi:hypothetical protein